MTKIRKQKRNKKFRANVNRKRLRNKLQKVPKIECEEIENSWESKRSIRTNLRDMGLAYDPNEAMKILSTKREIVKDSKIGKKGIENGKRNEQEGKGGEGLDDNEEENITGNNIQREKIHVVNKLEADAKAPRQRMFRLPNSQVQFVTYLMEKYGDDYKAMARDRKNHYQMTWCQIRAKINTFKSIPEQYAEYLIKSGEIVLDDPTPLEETRRRLGEENAKIHCVPRKRKLPPSKESTKSIWTVDSVEDEVGEFVGDKKEENSSIDSNREDKTQASNGLKKLKLFSDEELSDDENNGGNKIEEKTKKKASGLLRNANEKSETKGKDNLKRDTKKSLKIEKSLSSDSEDEDEEFEGDDEAEGFLNLSDVISEDEELSEEDVLDDGEFLTDSNDDGD